MFKRKKKNKKSENDQMPEEGLDDNFDTSTENDDQPAWVDEEAEEGRLSVDVYQDDQNIIIKSTIAGVEPDDLDISLNNDMLTIRGERQLENVKSTSDYLYQECYWGAFSRSIILPEEVDMKRIDATIKNGVLTLILPKVSAASQKKIKVKDKN